MMPALEKVKMIYFLVLDQRVLCLANRRAKLGHYHSCGDNHGIRPPNPEQYLTPLQQKEVAIRHLKTKLLESENTVHDRYSCVMPSKMLNLHCVDSLYHTAAFCAVYSCVHGQSLYFYFFILLLASTICIVYKLLTQLTGAL